MNKCDPLPFTYTGWHFPNVVHGHEAAHVVSVHCAVKYYYFIKRNDEDAMDISCWFWESYTGRSYT